MVHELAGRCDGLVILGRTVSNEVVADIGRRGLPLVLLARTAVGDIDSVQAENVETAKELGRHLLSRGARSLMFVGDPASSPDVAERWLGLEAAVAESEASTIRQLSPGGLGEEAGRRAARMVMEAGLPDALVCANDELALGVLDGLRATGVDVPGDVAVTGWDDIMAARYAGLTTVRQPMRELGATAARMLDELITGTRSVPRHEVLPTELVIRSSSVLPERTMQ
jgi:LacI family transcriptional regulator